MSDTPRTDACIMVWEVATPRDGREMVSADFARTLERELQASQVKADDKDKARLDWLEQRTHSCGRNFQDWTWWVGPSGGPAFNSPSLRAAIDAARKAHP